MTRESRTIAVTGANGFIGKNLVLRLREQGHRVWPVSRDTSPTDADRYVARADVIFHLAGANRPVDESEFVRSNRDYTAWLAGAAAAGKRKPLIVYSSSTKAGEDGAYGTTKLAAEQILLDLAGSGGATVSIWRLPNVCGKWSRPNYNSVVATFCYDAAHGRPLRIDDPAAPVILLYVDDLIDEWLALVARPPLASGFAEARQVHKTTVGEIADFIQAFAHGRARGEVCDVGTGLRRALYVSFMSALPVTDAGYPLSAHKDGRGRFVEVLKTPAAGQVSYFTANPGATRGGHYHHSKVEKFLVTHGTGRFRFRHALSGESFELVSSSAQPLIVETIPGWAHDVTNVGEDELVVLTWANERFDHERPDTFAMPL